MELLLEVGAFRSLNPGLSTEVHSTPFAHKMLDYFVDILCLKQVPGRPVGGNAFDFFNAHFVYVNIYIP